jgi:hypothetical protein
MKGSALPKPTIDLLRPLQKRPMTQQTILVISAVLLVSCITGCGTVATPVSQNASGVLKREKVVSYELGKSAKAYVGEAVVIRKSYYYREGPGSFSANKDFVIQGGMLSATVNAQGKATVQYQVIGTLAFKGELIEAIEIPHSAAYRFAYGITKDGKFSGVVAGWSAGLTPLGVNNYRITPNDVVFSRGVPSRVVAEDQPYENFEILYSGTSAGSMRLLYREYTQRDLIRPGFSQELSYPADAKQIRIKAMLIDVLFIGADSIMFRVIGDGGER